MCEGAAVRYFSVADLVNYYDTENPTDPYPAPGVVTAANGENDFNVEISLSDGSTRIEKHVGAQVPAVDPDPSLSVRWIELRDRDAGEL